MVSEDKEYGCQIGQIGNGLQELVFDAVIIVSKP
jgi:hypothetical protein